MSHGDHDIHGPVVYVQSGLIVGVDDCDCLPGCPECEDEEEST